MYIQSKTTKLYTEVIKLNFSPKSYIISITLGNKIILFFKTRSNFLYILERNDVLSDFPWIKQFSRDYMLKSPRMHNFVVTLFFTLARKKYCLSKRLKFFNILWSGIVPLTRCSLQNFPTPHSFPVISCWSFENSKISLFIYNFWYIFSFEKIFVHKCI